MTEKNDLFKIDLSQNDFLDPTESKKFDGLFQTTAGTNLFDAPSSSPFDNATQTEQPVVVQVKEEEKPPVVPVNKEEKKPTGKAKGKDKKNIKPVDKKNIKVDTTWNIAYAAQQYNPPENDMTLEQVREWLELDYPELSKERCHMDVDADKKLIVPIVKGAKNG
ncbi:hypothetical protein [Bacillus cereus group sp. Bce040]|uniref:hypothetical protein n=1 Tax=Bacillus cereus group sp. Bce040 TaxID=3445229 RepID=UPI003F27A6A2